MKTVCAVGFERPLAYMSAGDSSPSQESADGNISVQRACSQITR
jgi:hypothetical protein